MNDVNEKIIVLTSDNCPNCPFVKRQTRKIARELNINLVEKNIDKEEEAIKIIYKYGMWIPDTQALKKGEVKRIYGVPQLFYVSFEETKKGDWHYIAIVDEIPKQKVKSHIKKRLVNILDGDSPNYLKQDMKSFKPLGGLMDVDDLKEVSDKEIENQIKEAPTVWEIRKRAEKILEKK